MYYGNIWDLDISSIPLEIWGLILLGTIGFFWLLIKILSWLSRIGTVLSIYNEYEGEFIHEYGGICFDSETEMKKHVIELAKKLAYNSKHAYDKPNKKVKK